MSTKKGLFYVFISTLISTIIGLFSGFVLPKFLSVDTYANINLFKLYVSFVGILHLGFSDGMYMRLGGKNIDSIDKNDIISELRTFKIFQFVIDFIIIILSIIIKNDILFYIGLVILPVNVTNCVLSMNSAIGEFKRYSWISNINSILVLTVNVILLFILKTDLYPIYIICYIIVYFIIWIYIEYENKKIFGVVNQKWKFDSKYFIEDIKLGFFLMIGNFCSIIFTSIDKLFVKNLLGMTKFAYYSFAVSIEGLMNLFITPISTVMYNYFCKQKNLKKIIIVKKYVMIFSSVIIISIYPAKFIIERWIPKYIESIYVLFILVAAHFFSILIKTIHINLYKANKKQNKYFIIMMVIIILSFIFNIVGYIINKSMLSISIATFITNLIWFLVGEIDFKKYIMNISDYIFLLFNITSFVLCGMLLSSILGLIIYSIGLVISIIIFERKEIISIKELILTLLHNKFLKKI